MKIRIIHRHSQDKITVRTIKICHCLMGEMEPRFEMLGYVCGVCGGSIPDKIAQRWSIANMVSGYDEYEED